MSLTIWFQIEYNGMSLNERILNNSIIEREYKNLEDFKDKVMDIYTCDSMWIDSIPTIMKYALLYSF